MRYTDFSKKHKQEYPDDSVYGHFEAIHINDSLDSIFHYLKNIYNEDNSQVSLDPKFVLSSGFIIDIQVELGKYTLHIKSQRPRKNTIEQTILSPDIETYKRFNEAKYNIYQAIPKKIKNIL